MTAPSLLSNRQGSPLLATFLLFFASFLYYLYGLPGTVPSYRDSGDLIAAIHTLGIAHPPGYALYVLIGKLFVTLIPFGNVAYRVNVMSAFFAALTVALLYKVLRHGMGSDLAFMHRGSNAQMQDLTPCLVTFLFAASPALMALARVAEMYTLSAFLATLILYCLLSDLPRGPAYAALLLGLGLSVHPTLIFLLPLFFVFPRRTISRSSALYFFLGLLIFLYLPIRAAQHPLVNWGDPSSWRNFWRVVTRADYGGLKLHPGQSVFSWSPESVAAQLQYFLLTLKGEWGWGTIGVGVVGIAALLRERQTRRWGLALLFSWLLAGPGFFLLSNLPLQEATTPAILQPYLLLPNLLWAIFAMAGLGVLAALRRPSLIIPALAGGLLLATKPWGWTSSRFDFYSYDYARNLLRSLPHDAVLYDPDDTTHFSIQVLQTVEQRRPDVVLLSFFRTRWGYEQIKRRWPDLLPPVPLENSQALQRALWTYSARRQPFYAELPQKLSPVPSHPQGLVYAADVDAKPDAAILSLARAESLLALYTRRGDLVTTHHADFFTRHLIGYYAAAHCNLGLAYANRKEWTKAVEHYRAALEIDPELPAAYNNWGIVAFEHSDYLRAAELFQKGLAFDPKNEMLQKNVQFALQKMRKLL